MRSYARARIDLFAEDLFGEAAPRDPEPSDGGFRGPEPFFSDARHQCWQVVARPGDTKFNGLRHDDLIVQRSPDGTVSWRCVPASALDPRKIFVRGADGAVRDDVVVLRRVRRRRIPLVDEAESGEVVEVPGFFGPNDVRRSEQEIRDAVVARATAEWNAWHSTAGAPRPEGDAGMFGRLVGYYLAATGQILPDTLIAAQTAALAANYGTLLAAGTTAATIATETTRLAGDLLTGAPGATAAGVVDRFREAISHAREAHTNRGDYSAWSAAFVVACVRGAAIAQGLEAAIGPGRRHVGRDELLLGALTHAEYTIEARRRRAQTLPRRRGTYHAFAPRERVPRPGDIIVQDRRDTLTTAAQVFTLAGLADGKTHGDIVVDVQPGFAVTIGGNLGDSSRRRRYPRDAGGLLVVSRRELYTSEDNAGTLPALPVQSALPLHMSSTARIFALLSPVEERAAVPGQPYAGGILT
ncbi:MAG TPA: hypothetical protein VKE51_31310 [Vicinamibacterales bacterium]|nr:hypothetical protein [Vicinamibacterales bacterium]